MEIRTGRQCKNLVTLNSLQYGEVCRLPDKKKIYMYLKTTQHEVGIVKKEHIALKIPNSKKLLDLETGDITCVPSNSKVIKVSAYICVEEDLF